MRVLLAVLTLAALASVASAQTAPDPPARFAEQFPDAAAAVRAGEPLVVRVLVPLCHREQIACGEGALGDPGDLRRNLYWGALYGARRFFERRELGWESLDDQPAPAGILERRVFRRRVAGEPWGASTAVELLVVLDAVHGARIDEAVGAFWREATSGSKLRIRDGERERELGVSVAGYAGHNRLMDGLRLPAPERGRRVPLPSFVLACRSEAYFADGLGAAGSTPLVTTTALMAPEGYLLEATARTLGANPTRAELRRSVVAAYARWQKLSLPAASRIFAQ
jgi:hypothetical protein